MGVQYIRELQVTVGQWLKSLISCVVPLCAAYVDGNKFILDIFLLSRVELDTKSDLVAPSGESNSDDKRRLLLRKLAARLLLHVCHGLLMSCATSCATQI